MSIPRQTGARALAALGVACLAAAFPLGRAAQDAGARRQPDSPNGKIVFQSTQGGDGFANDIYVMDADGKRQTRLTDDPADDASAVWSPQGDRIAFVSKRRGQDYEIYVMNGDGGDQRPLRAASPVYATAAEWSPDGTRLMYTDLTDVYVVEVDGESAPANVSGGKALGSTDLEASWAPGGASLVVRNSTPCGGCTDLYTVNADGSGRAPLITAPGFDAHPRWSPSGGQVAYEADRGGRGIYVASADGTGERLVSGAVGSLGGAVWSPDGARLAFVSELGGVYVVNPDGSGLTRLTDVTADAGGGLFWSPDGSKVAFHSSNGSSADLYVVGVGDGRRATNYTKTRRDDEYGASWQKLATP